MILAKVGSREHWRDRDSYPQDWETRAAQAARFIAPSSIVIDIGCGPHMALGRHLPPGCIYHPADLYQWTPQVRYADIDANVFPDGPFDCVALLGVIEYLTKPQLAFAFAQSCACAMVVSYCYPLSADHPREEAGWVNAFSPDEFHALVARHGWNISRSETFARSKGVDQVIHALRHSRSKPETR